MGSKNEMNLEDFSIEVEGYECEAPELHCDKCHNSIEYEKNTNEDGIVGYDASLKRIVEVAERHICRDTGDEWRWGFDWYTGERNPEPEHKPEQFKGTVSQVYKKLIEQELRNLIVVEERFSADNSNPFTVNTPATPEIVTFKYLYGVMPVTDDMSQKPTGESDERSV